MGAPSADDLESVIDSHLTNLRREALDILRVHHYGYLEDGRLRERITQLKDKGKVPS